MLRALRQQAGLTQEELCRRSGVAVRTVRNIERGDVVHPRSVSLRLIAEALGVAPQELLGPALSTASTGMTDSPDTQRRPRQLPATPADFTGRQEVLNAAHELLTDLDVTTVPGSLSVLNICGRPGVGKTTLAVVLGHLVRERFDAGQLFVAMDGATRAPRSPLAMLEELLMSLGVEGKALPSTISGRAALFREKSADRNLLFVLDDAGDEQQTLPLLPVHPSVVVVTSRRPLAGLAGVRIIDLDVMPEHEAAELVTRVSGRDRSVVDRDDLMRIARACAGLPLALRIAGARLASRPSLPVAALAADLDDERRRLDTLRFADLEVRSTLALACAALTDEQRLAFALLGRLNSRSVTAWNAAFLLGVEHKQALQMLEALVDARLVDMGPVDAFGEPRYRLHDLLRLFAREMPVDENRWRAALLRLIGSWLTLTEIADAALPVTSDIVTLGSTLRFPIPAALEQRVRSEPLTWFASEEDSLVAAVDQLVTEGHPEPAWELTSSIRTYVMLQSHWDVWERTHRVTLESCLGSGDHRGAASMYFGLGKLRIDVHGAVQKEPEELLTAIRLYAQMGDATGEARALHELAHWTSLVGNLDEGERHCRRALALAEACGSTEVLADVLYLAGRIQNWLKRPESAVAMLERALTLSRRLAKPRNEAQVLWQLASVYSQSLDWDRATALLTSALLPLRAMNDRKGEIRVLLDLAKVKIAVASYAPATEYIERCLDLCEQIGEKSLMAEAYVVLGHLRDEAGDGDAARAALETSSRLWRDLGDDVRVAEVAGMIRTATVVD
ncbi:tetratricopeptide repeat protein [Actinoplanes sp. NPDC051633]|uniref:tetratricopeptide repeat protein n=1 Tax=Actinoplanes sp. NPDC051633 TaxID=3155670 RepID=UPI003430FB63